MAQWTPPPPPGMPAPNNNLTLAIIATVVSVVFCCGLPHGLISLVFATQVNKKVAMNDMVGAVNSARQAKMWALVSIVIAVLGIVIGFALGILNAVVSTLSSA